MKPKANFAKLLTALLLAAILITTLPAPLLAAGEPAAPQNTYSFEPIDLAIAQIETTNYHSIVLDTDGNVWTWGGNTNGQIGDGPLYHILGLTKVELPLPAVKVCVSDNQSAALLEDGTVFVWGSGYLKLDYVTDYYRPYHVRELDGAVDILAGQSAMYALLADGTVYAWGDNTYAQCATGDTQSLEGRMVQVDLPGQAVKLYTLRYGVLAQLADGTVYCWGWNERNALALPSAGEYVTTPQLSETFTGTNVRSIDGQASCYWVTPENELYVWGDNRFLRFGMGTPAGYDMPVFCMDNVADAKYTIGVGVVLKTDGTVWVAGQNVGGLSGLGHADGVSYSEFTQIESLSGIKAITTTNNNVFAVTENGQVWAWGYLGFGHTFPGVKSAVYANAPVLIFGGTTTPVDPDPDTHNVTVVVKYTDGAHPDEVTTYAVPEGAEFFEGYTVQPGYKYRGVSLYSFFYNVDSFEQTVYISEVYQDITVELNYDPVPTHNVTVTIRYEDGALPDAVETYAVPAGEAFSTAYEMLEGYTLRNVEANALGVAVDGVDQTISIRAVNGAIDILIILAQE